MNMQIRAYLLAIILISPSFTRAHQTKHTESIDTSALLIVTVQISLFAAIVAYNWYYSTKESHHEHSHGNGCCGHSHSHEGEEAGGCSDHDGAESGCCSGCESGDSHDHSDHDDHSSCSHDHSHAHCDHSHATEPTSYEIDSSEITLTDNSGDTIEFEMNNSASMGVFAPGFGTIHEFTGW